MPPPALAGNPWFASLPAPERRLLVARCERRLLAPGEMLFRQGDAVPAAGGCFYGLAQGHIKVSSLRPDGREAILAVLEAGNWFGEISLIDRQPRTHDATAVGPAEVLALPRAAFDALMKRSGFALGICRLLAARTRALYGMVEDATLRSTRARVARRLLLLAHGDASLQAATRATVPVSQEALAMMLGITRQTLSKELKGLVAAGAISLGYGRIEIERPGVLEGWE